jgi:hypothetical protein
MSDSRRDARDVSALVGDLARTVEELQSDLEPDRRPPLRPPTPRDLARFTSEVTIPAIVLALETNVRVLKLLQRTLRLAAGEDPGTGETARTRERAEAVGRRTLARLDDALADLQSALDGRPPDDPARELLDEARALRVEIDDRLQATDADIGRPDGRPGDGPAGPFGDRASVDIDVESELRSIKDDIEDGNDEDTGG